MFINSAHWIESLGTLVIGSVYFLTILIGIFPYPTPLHDPLALVQFFLIPVGLWVYGIGNILRGAAGLGAVTIVLGIIVVGGVIWLLTVAATGSQAFALPELAITIPFDTWSVITAWRLYHTQKPDYSSTSLPDLG